MSSAAKLDFMDLISNNWWPTGAKLIEVSANNANSVSIYPKLGKRHKLLDVSINWTGSLVPSSPPYYDAVDIILGAKTITRFPYWLWGNASTDIGNLAVTNSTTRNKWFLASIKTLNLIDLLWDAAQDETITLNIVSGADQSVINIKYLEYEAKDNATHEVPGGSEYYKKIFVDWWNILATTTGNMQALSEGPMPAGQKLLGQNGRLPPTLSFEQMIIATGYPNAYQNSSVTNYSTYNAIHEFDGDEELWTPDTHQGIYCNQEASGTSTELTGFLVLRPVYRHIFGPNSLLGLYADVTSVTGSGGPLYAYLFGVLTDLEKQKKLAGGAGGGT